MLRIVLFVNAVALFVAAFGSAVVGNTTHDVEIEAVGNKLVVNPSVVYAAPGDEIRFTTTNVSVAVQFSPSTPISPSSLTIPSGQNASAGVDGDAEEGDFSYGVSCPQGYSLMGGTPKIAVYRPE